jgi:hypothetical protein
MIFRNKAFALNSVNEIILKRYAVISAKAVGTGSHTYLPVTTRCHQTAFFGKRKTSVYENCGHLMYASVL